MRVTPHDQNRPCDRRLTRPLAPRLPRPWPPPITSSPWPAPSARSKNLTTGSARRADKPRWRPWTLPWMRPCSSSAGPFMTAGGRWISGSWRHPRGAPDPGGPCERRGFRQEPRCQCRGHPPPDRLSRPAFGNRRARGVLDDDQGGQPFFASYGATKSAQIALGPKLAGRNPKTGPAIRILSPRPMPTATRARFHPGEDRSALTEPRAKPPASCPRSWDNPPSLHGPGPPVLITKLAARPPLA